MNDWSVPLADVIIDDGDLEAIVSTYRSGWLSMGPRIEEFEGAFAAYLGVRHAIAYATKSREITSLKPQQHGLRRQAVSGRATATQMRDRRQRAAGRARRVRCR